MAKTFEIVLGANYGDEGKGLVADMICHKYSDKKVLNVLFNGGPQRGHTVELKDGTRHVFHHLGAGTFAGARTYFDKDFLIEPSIFCTETNELAYDQCVYVNENCRVITIMDVMLNRYMESKIKKVGSCGLGVWETMRRYEVMNKVTSEEYAPNIKELFSMTQAEIKHYFAYIANIYVRRELKNRGLSVQQQIEALEFIKSYNTHEYAEGFYVWLRKMKLQCVLIDNDRPLFDRFDVIVFEGAQGLLLDHDNESEKPHVTSSNTTSKIPVKRIEEYTKNTDKLTVNYVSRRYLTRHGTGPLKYECSREEVGAEADITNVFNANQGEFRYSPLNEIEMIKRCMKDSGSIRIPHDTNIFITHEKRPSVLQIMSIPETGKQDAVNYTVQRISVKAMH